ncbi:YdbL family protein [Aquipseudomonas campi]
MKLRSKLAYGLLTLCLSLPAMALSLNEAMSALGPAKAAGQLGEQPDGYLGVVSNSGQAGEVARLINQARQAEYQRLAKDNGLQLGDVEALAGQKALEKTPSGQYIQVNGKWVRK